MLRLHGFATSNYHNLVKLVLLEKGVEFEEVPCYPPADEAYRKKNATGHYPCLEAEDGTWIGESKVIIEYLEDAFPEVPMLPPDPRGRALVRELLTVIDLYLEWPARRLYPEALFGGTVSDETKQAARLGLDRGLAGLEQRARFDPYIAGPQVTLADFSAVVHLPIVSMACKAIYGEDLLVAVPAVKAHRALMRERASVQRVEVERKADLATFMAHQAGPSGPT